MGEGPDHGLYDVYIGGSLWQSFNGYAASAGERVIPIPLSNDRPFTLQVNNRADKGSASSGHVMRFKQLSVDAEYTLQTIGYTYDAASRVLAADYFPGENTASTPAQTFAYEYDVAGNLTDNNGAARTFNKLNQISGDNTHTYTFDMNGNLLQKLLGSTPVETFVWDRANRLLSMGGHEYAYDGLGNRVSQTASSVVTQYLLDLQPGLVQVIAATVGGNSESYVHSPRGIHLTQDTSDDWRYTLQDGLGSVRGEIDAVLGIDALGEYAPYGVPLDVEGAYTQPFRFTGEMRDENALQYHRARYYLPSSAEWSALDPKEGRVEQPNSINAYIWAMDNPAMNIDPTGEACESWDKLMTGSTGGCQVWDFTCPGTPRKAACIKLQLAFALGIMPSYDTLIACYSCDPTITLLPDPHSKVADFKIAIDNALVDGIVNRDDAERYKQLVSDQYAAMLTGLALEQGTNGYLEGTSGAVALLAGMQISRELVYNFATFQRATFAASGFGLITQAGGGLSVYWGRIWDFAKGNPFLFDNGAFFSQYSGQATVRQSGYPKAFASFGGTYFFGYPGDYPAYSGNTYYLGAGIAFAPIGEVASWEMYAYPQGDRKSYVDRATCRVNISELRSDIMSGEASPLFGFDDILMHPIRQAAVSLAEFRATQFDDSMAGKCPC